MEDFTSRMATPNAASDPSKHVNYTYGMVLGVDDLTQEFAYHSGRDQWTMRDLIGYGTANGLRVTTGPNANGEMEVTVSPGTAVSPRGQLIHVPAAQCANLAKWLAIEKNHQAVGEEITDPVETPLILSVVLCYRSCPTDKVPVPGEPCRSEEDSMAYSRLRDDFKLELRIKRAADPPSPDRREESALRDFVKWLNEHVTFTDDVNDLDDEPAFVNALREAAHPIMSPPTELPPDFMLDNSPPNPLRLPNEQACYFLRLAFRLWTTELRPRWRPAQFNTHSATCSAEGGDAGTITDDNCVLLADLMIALTGDLLLDTSQPITLLEDRRPYLVHLRMLQEWLTCGRFGAAADIIPVETSAERVLPFVSMVAFFDGGEPFYRMWFQLDAPDNRAVISSFDPSAVSARLENDTPPEFFDLIDVLDIKPVSGVNNVFDVHVSKSDVATRFVFDLKVMNVDFAGDSGVALSKYASDQNIKFIGQSDDATVTAFAPLAAPII